MRDLLFARQPMFDDRLDVIGYELFFRTPGSDRAVFVSPDRASSKVILNALVDLSATRLFGAHPVFLNVGPHLIESELVDCLPVERVVLELVGVDRPDNELPAALDHLARRGFQLALDFDGPIDVQAPLLPFVSWARINLTDDLADVEERRRLAVEHHATPIAARIETHEGLARARELGFRSFQGFFLSRPRVIMGRSPQAHQTTLMRLLAEFNAPGVTQQRLEEVIRTDVGMSFRLLKLINSAFYRLPREVSTIRQALALLGMRQTRQWLSLMALAGFDDKPTELFHLALVRARMAELLACAVSDPDPARFFIGGLFSVLDAMLDRPLDDILDDMPISDEIRAALLDGEGIVGQAVRCVVAQERCEVTGLSFQGLDQAVIQDAWLDAIDWSGDVASSLGA